MSAQCLRTLAAAALAALAFAAPACATEAPIAPEPYFSHADMAALRLSPSGRRIGALVPVRGRVALAVMDLDDRKPRVVARFDGEDVRDDFAWVSDDRLLLSVVDLQAGLGEQRGGGLFAVDHDGTSFRELSPTLAKLEAMRYRVYHYTRLLVAPGDGDAILALSNERNVNFPDVYRVDTRTGQRDLLTFDRPGDPVRWVVDRRGAARGVVTVEKGTLYRSWWRSAAEAPWRLIREYTTEQAGVVPIAFDGDGSLVVASSVGRDTHALYRFDEKANGPGELLAAHPHVDLTSGLVWDAGRQRIVGLRYDAAKPGYAWFDDEWAQLSAVVDLALPGRFNVLARGSGGRVLVTSVSDRDPGSWYLFDPQARRLEFLAAHRKAIVPASMPAREPLRYKARDGLEIPAYLTLPPGREAKSLPLVLYVHGGPWVRGARWTWSATPAWLAAQGYAVLEPEFRGSTGWGGRHFTSGWRQWGRAMQDDLLDGIDHLAARGVVDPGRVCIMGASYGGYAVMMGLARDAARFRCGVNYLGVTDIALLFDWTWARTETDFMKYNARQLIGDPERDAERLREVSPLANAAKIRAPVLMAYGARDRRVPLVHGERMRDALTAQGTPVEWVAYSEEGHGFMREANRYDFYARVQRFLAKHL